MPIEDPSVRAVSLFLFRPEVQRPEDAFDPEVDRAALRQGRRDADPEVEFAWHVATGVPRPTSWARDLAELVGVPTVEARAMSSSAALAFRLRDPAGQWRVMASAWGHGGRHMLDHDKIEDRFGITTALNIIDDEKVRSKDSRSFDDTIKQTRTQASRRTAFNEFGFDPTREILDEVTAQTLAAYAGFADRVSGSHYLQLTAPMEADALFSKGQEALRLYGLRDYETRFPWVKSKRSVTNPIELRRLDKELVERLQSGDTANIHLAPPQVVDWNDIEGFRYKGERAPTLHPDLNLQDYLARIDVQNLDAERLHDDVVRVKFLGHDSDDKWPIYKCLVGELDVGGQKMVLSAGRWFTLDRTWVDQIEDKLQTIETGQALPDAASHDQHEDAYNISAAEQLGAVCMDKVPLRALDASSDIELCDILTDDLRFVHVKKRESSATLSHLFFQGSVSAQTLVSDRTFRQRSAEKIAERAPEYARLADWPNIQASDVEVVYAVIAEERFEGKDKLPFFAKVGLCQAVDGLRRMSFDVSFSSIVRPPPAEI